MLTNFLLNVIGNYILGIPMLCLLGSILYCGVCLWKVYQKPIHRRVHRIMESIGFWKTGMGRWRSLALGSCLYFGSAVCSIVVSILSYLLKPEDLVFTWTRDLKEYIPAASFALITMIISLSMYGLDFSKLGKRLDYFFEKVLIFIVPVILWIILGIGAYKDLLSNLLSNGILECLSSTRDVFGLFLGIASLLVMIIAVYKTYRYLWIPSSKSI